jgi:hypothetical protein
MINPLNAELNPISYLLTLLDHHILKFSRIGVKIQNIKCSISLVLVCSGVFKVEMEQGMGVCRRGVLTTTFRNKRIIKKRDSLEDLDLDGTIIFNYIL